MISLITSWAATGLAINVSAKPARKAIGRARVKNLMRQVVGFESGRCSILNPPIRLVKLGCRKPSKGRFEIVLD
jgi:hypothetical protein